MRNMISNLTEEDTSISKHYIILIQFAFRQMIFVCLTSFNGQVLKYISNVYSFHISLFSGHVKTFNIELWSSEIYFKLSFFLRPFMEIWYVLLEQITRRKISIFSVFSVYFMKMLKYFIAIFTSMHFAALEFSDGLQLWNHLFMRKQKTIFFSYQFIEHFNRHKCCCLNVCFPTNLMYERISSWALLLKAAEKVFVCLLFVG